MHKQESRVDRYSLMKYIHSSLIESPFYLKKESDFYLRDGSVMHIKVDSNWISKKKFVSTGKSDVLTKI